MSKTAAFLSLSPLGMHVSVVLIIAVKLQRQQVADCPLEVNVSEP